MQTLLIPIIIATALAINAAGSYQILTPNHQQAVLCVTAIVQRHFSSTYSIIVSVTKTEHDDNENSRLVSPYWGQALKTDALLSSIHSDAMVLSHLTADIQSTSISCSRTQVELHYNDLGITEQQNCQ
jgi:hypothetical protein